MDPLNSGNVVHSYINSCFFSVFISKWFETTFLALIDGSVVYNPSNALICVTQQSLKNF